MKFVYEGEALASRERAESTCWLLTNGLGGYMSLSAAFSVTRCDQGMLVAARSPSRRFCLVHRLREELIRGEERDFLSGQSFAQARPEEGWRLLRSFVRDDLPEWRYETGNVRVTRRCGMAWGENSAAAVYLVENGSDAPCVLRVTPVFQCAPKGEPPQAAAETVFSGGQVECRGMRVFVRSTGELRAAPVRWETLRYDHDSRDGRPGSGMAFSCCQTEITVLPGQTGSLEIAFGADGQPDAGGRIVEACRARQRALLDGAKFTSPAARELVRAADAFIAYRSSTGGKTVIAGYPFFGDWGRDTMIALPGCTLATGRFEDARSILRTFLAYERDGLVPNYFPEGGETPAYNSADAPLLLVNGVWLYCRASGDRDFAREAYPVLKRIAEAYEKGTRYAIGMDEDGLIRAGEGLDQVTWMDVRVGDILPTPRHGKPVEINAYWYNALRILERLAPLAGEDGGRYGRLAERTRSAFNREFWMEDRGYLRDVISGTKADTQLRCNQIWAVTMPFTMLPPERERRVVQAVGERLFTTRGLRTLSPDDPEFRPFYGGPQLQRDLAYHQGTVWPFPLGAYYLAVMKVDGGSRKSASLVLEGLRDMEDILREGCAGQIPEIYDGGTPGESKGCFAQAWSVGEILRAYERAEAILTGNL